MSAVLFFHCDVISYKLSKLSCIILYYIEIKASLYLATFFVDLLENWYKMRKIIVYNWNFRILVKYLEEGVKRGPSLTLSWRRPLSYRNLSIDLLQLLLQILQSSFKAIYRYQTAEPCKYLEVKNLIFGHFSKIRKLNNPTVLLMS